MRITFALSQDRAATEINRKKEDIDRLSTNISSGKKLLSPSDDPLAWAQGMGIKQGLRELDTFQKNIDFATGWNQMTDTALDHFYDLVKNARQIGIDAMDNQTLEQRDSQLAFLDQVIQAAVDTANTEYGDRYIFSGLTDPGPNGPFTLDGTSIPPIVNYSGGPDTERLLVRTGRAPSYYQQVNLGAMEVFGFTRQDGTSSDALNELLALKQAVSDGNSAGIRDAVTNLNTIQHNLTAQQSVVGWRLSNLESQKSALQAVKTNQQDQLSKIEDANLPEAIIQLQQTQTALEATLQATAMLKDLNLLNFL